MRLATDPDVDWTMLLAHLRTGGADLEVLHADDPARNIDDLRRSEASVAGDDAKARREAWQRLVEFDAETKALRAVLPLLQQLAPGNGTLQDPRLQQVARIAEAEAAFWQVALGGGAVADSAVIPPLPATTSLRIAPAGPQEPSEVTVALNEARLRLGARRWIVARTAFAEVQAQCREVAAHATAVAGRTRDARVAERYRELAARCTAVVQAIDAACAK